MCRVDGRSPPRSWRGSRRSPVRKGSYSSWPRSGLGLARRNAGSALELGAAAPLAIVPAHLIWRRLFYGVWLPNTWYAKSTGVWPGSGLRYLLSFVIEYSLWITIAVGLVWAWRCLRAAGGPGADATDIGGPATARRRRLACAVAAFLIPFARYFINAAGITEYRARSGPPPLAL